MIILGIDLGERKTGISIAYSKIPEPYGVIRVKDTKGLTNKLKEIIKKEKVEKVVVGISEGKMGEKQKKIAQELSRGLETPVETFDETLTTKEANKLAIESQISRKRRKNEEDSFAASLMLQFYLDENA